jgi:succinate dehydrogenase hydrophobic anchor subunit
LALLTPSVLLFTALHGRSRWTGSPVAFLLPLVLLAAGGVLMFSGLYWLSASTGGGDEELNNWRVLSRAAAVVALAMMWQSFGRMRRVLYDDPGWKTSRYSVIWIVLLVLPLLLMRLPSIRRRVLAGASQRRSARILRWGVMLFISLVIGLWVVVTDEQAALIRRDWFVSAFTFVLAAGLGTVVAVFEITLPALPLSRSPSGEGNSDGLRPKRRQETRSPE